MNIEQRLKKHLEGPDTRPANSYEFARNNVEEDIKPLGLSVKDTGDFSFSIMLRDVRLIDVIDERMAARVNSFFIAERFRDNHEGAQEQLKTDIEAWGTEVEGRNLRSALATRTPSRSKGRFL